MKKLPKPAEFRRYLLDSAMLFTRAAAKIHGIRQISFVGSITTERPNPKDIDLLVTITDDADTAALAGEARRLKGRAQQVNLGADVFLIDERGNYIGRTCHWKDCRPGVRSACDARHCGGRPFVHDDLDVLQLPREVISALPVTVWPEVIRRCAFPRDVAEVLGQCDAV